MASWLRNTRRSLVPHTYPLPTPQKQITLLPANSGDGARTSMREIPATRSNHGVAVLVCVFSEITHPRGVSQWDDETRRTPEK